MSLDKIKTEKLQNGILFTVDGVFNRLISYNPKSGNRAVFKYERPLLKCEIEDIRESVKRIVNE